MKIKCFTTYLYTYHLLLDYFNVKCGFILLYEDWDNSIAIVLFILKAVI